MGKRKHQKAVRITEIEHNAADHSMTPEQVQHTLAIANRRRTFGSVKFAGRNTKAATSWRREGSLVG